MRTSHGIYLVVSAALCLTGCNRQQQQTGASDVANDAAAANGSAEAAVICTVEQQDTRGWTGKANADQSVTVSGEVRVADSRYRASLFNPQVQGSEARAYVTQAENNSGQAPAGGWWPVSLTIPDNGSIQTVGIWCDMDTQFASIPVRRGAQAAAGGATPAAARVPFRGCVARSDLGSGCLTVKSDDGKTYELYSNGALPDPAQRLVVEGFGNSGGITSCMVGTPLTDVQWHYTKAKCPEGGKE